MILLQLAIACGILLLVGCLVEKKHDQLLQKEKDNQLLQEKKDAEIAALKKDNQLLNTLFDWGNSKADVIARQRTALLSGDYANADVVADRKQFMREVAALDNQLKQEYAKTNELKIQNRDLEIQVTNLNNKLNKEFTDQLAATQKRDKYKALLEELTAKSSQLFDIDEINNEADTFKKEIEELKEAVCNDAIVTGTTSLIKTQSFNDTYIYEDNKLCVSPKNYDFVIDMSNKKRTLRLHNFDLMLINRKLEVADKDFYTIGWFRTYTNQKYGTKEKLLTAHATISREQLQSRLDYLRKLGGCISIHEYTRLDPRKTAQLPRVRNAVMARDKNVCQCCGADLSNGIGAQIDHIYPVSKGGKTCLSNLRLLCDKCNNAKSDRFIEADLEELKKYAIA